MKKIVVSTSSFGVFSKKPIYILKKANIKFELNSLTRTLSEKEIIQFLKDKDGIIAGTEPLNENVLSKCSNLKVISRVGAGLDNVDLDFAKKKNIQVFNTPDGPTNAVAELTIGLMLNSLRHIVNSDRNIRDGLWNKEMGTLLHNKNVGIVGFGRIGKRVAELMKFFNCTVFIYDPFIQSIDIDGMKHLQSLDELMRTVDIVSLHIPYSKENHHIINKNRLEMMKTGAFLINAARGGLIDEDALFNILKSGQIAGAALDTYENEPYRGNLTQLDNVILTSHIGSYAKESRIKMEIDAVTNLLKGFENARY